MIRDRLKEIGVDMETKAVDVSVRYDQYSSLDYQLTSAYQERTVDPDNCYSLVIKSGGPSNTTGYGNPKVEALGEQAAASNDEAERMDLDNEIRGIVTEDAPLVFTHVETIHYLMNKNSPVR